MVRWRDRGEGSIACKSVECIRLTDPGVGLNIEPHSFLSDVRVWVKCGCVCVCVCPYLKTSGSGPIRSWEMVGISGLDQDRRGKREGREIASAREMRSGDEDGEKRERRRWTD